MRRAKSISLPSAICHLPSAICFFCLVCLGCNTGLTKEQPGHELFKQNPVSVNWDTGSSDKIESFSSDVEVYTMNNRKDTAMKLQNKYRITTKTINDVTYSRIDFTSSSIDSRMTAIVSDGTTTIMFDPLTNQVQMRLKESVPPALKTIGSLISFGRINLSLIRSEAQRAALDMSEESGNRLVINFPQSMLVSNARERLQSSKIVFDTKNEILVESETVRIQTDGTTTTTTTIPVYELVNDIPVKVGTYTTINTKVPTLIEGFNSDVKIVNSPDELPTLSPERAAELREAGQLFEKSDMVFGNPADLSSVVTVVEIYKDVEINQTSDDLFKMIMEDVK